MEPINIAILEGAHFSASTSMDGEAAKVNDDAEVVPPKTEESFFDSKLFRWISLFLYLGGISGLGMVLSLYYLIFFNSRMPDIHLRFPISIDGQPVQKVQEVIQ